jgi:putative endonuclease
MDAHQLGREGEAVVAHWYVNRGAEILYRNWRSPSGEIDLILREGPHVVFCEVKTRSSRSFGGAAAAVDWKKQRRLRRLASEFLLSPERQGQERVDVRFDVAEVYPDHRGAYSVTVIESAF